MAEILSELLDYCMKPIQDNEDFNGPPTKSKEAKSNMLKLVKFVKIGKLADNV